MGAPETINVGIIGCGWLTEAVHIPVLLTQPRVRLVAACDALAERRALMQRKFAVPRVLRDPAELLGDHTVDAVLIATTADSHAALAAAAVAAGKHVLVEKPMALGLDEARALLASTAGSKVVRLVGLNYRFHPLVLALRRALERGDIGRPLAVMCTMATAPNQKTSVTRYEADPERGGGVFHDKAVHVVDVLRFVLGSEAVACRVAARSRHEPHDLATVELEFGGGLHVAGFFSAGTSSDCSFVVMGEEGRAEINLARPFGLSLHRRPARNRSRRYWAHARVLGRLWTGVRLSSPRGQLVSYRHEWGHFLACIARGEPARPSFEDGLEVTRVVTALIRSAERGGGATEPV